MNSTISLAQTPGPDLNNSINYYIIRKSLWSSTFYLNRYGAILWMVLGLILNPLALITWTRPKLRRHNTSSNYLAGIALADFLFWLLYLLYYLKQWWNVVLHETYAMCELYQGLFISTQYFSVPLVLVFSIERYIAVCHPFLRDKICTHRRALINTIICGISVSILGFIQGATVFYDPNAGVCYPREIIFRSVYWTIFQTATEIIISALLPIATLIVNVLVILELRKITKKSSLMKPSITQNPDIKLNDQMTKQKPQMSAETKEKNAFRSSTVLLLSVSFILIVTTLPVGFVYSFQFLCPNGNENLTLTEMLTDPVWVRFANYQIIKELVDFFAQIHFVINFFIYYITGDNFRQEFHNIFSFCSRSSTSHSSLRNNGVNSNRSRRKLMSNDDSLLTNSHATIISDQSAPPSSVPNQHRRVNRTDMIRNPNKYQNNQLHSNDDL